MKSADDSRFVLMEHVKSGSSIHDSSSGVEAGNIDNNISTKKKRSDSDFLVHVLPYFCFVHQHTTLWRITASFRQINRYFYVEYRSLVKETATCQIFLNLDADFINGKLPKDFIFLAVWKRQRKENADRMHVKFRAT